MVSLKILDVKSFMGSLLIQKIFDNFMVSEAEVITYAHFSIDGKINQSFYTEEEKEELQLKKYAKWADIKPYVFSVVKGNKLPLFIKIVMLLSPENTEKLLAQSGVALSKEDINGLFLNIRYEKENLTIVTGTSIGTFTLDKTLDHFWDENVKKFLKKEGIAAEEE
ncbi:DUF5721 family protein [Anaerocolumna sp. AGMB13020]|uniref:DUF5721 family protein n=1 Tax=Anaerocolumna sp. AGMB13020 TaxID=3081750 RepID=UPI002955B052|nr:DUF5721 family protein [Anaerocolumna sp. AGMB13020]WOO36129.1 DUF5721 family protein [Anaerocolumna sp. AGMB13020]